MSAAIELVLPEKAEHTLERRRLPNDRTGISHDFVIAGTEVHFHTGEFEDGTIGEIFIEMPKSGSTMSGFLDILSTFASLSLQYGVPLEVLAEKCRGTNFEPNGVVAGGGVATSILDYIFTYVERAYGPST